MPSAASVLNLQTLIMAFIAGFLAVPIFHQGLYAALYHGGVIPKAKAPAPSNAPWDMTRVPPLGMPRILSSSFWGGVWAIVLLPFLAPLSGAAYWLAWFIVGGVALTLVFFFVVMPIKGQSMPFSTPRFLVGVALNGLWGIGTALILRYVGGIG